MPKENQQKDMRTRQRSWRGKDKRELSDAAEGLEDSEQGGGDVIFGAGGRLFQEAARFKTAAAFFNLPTVSSHLGDSGWQKTMSRRIGIIEVPITISSWCMSCMRYARSGRVIYPATHPQEVAVLA